MKEEKSRFYGEMDHERRRIEELETRTLKKEQELELKYKRKEKDIMYEYETKRS